MLGPSGALGSPSNQIPIFGQVSRDVILDRRIHLCNTFTRQPGFCSTSLEIQPFKMGSGSLVQDASQEGPVQNNWQEQQDDTMKCNWQSGPEQDIINTEEF
eukprot:217706-Rhodomonas_salina.2